jgi:hypothetical protein
VQALENGEQAISLRRIDTNAIIRDGYFPFIVPALVLNLRL